MHRFRLWKKALGELDHLRSRIKFVKPLVRTQGKGLSFILISNISQVYHGSEEQGMVQLVYSSGESHE